MFCNPPSPPPHTHTHTHTQHAHTPALAPAPYFRPLFLIFQIPHSGGGNQNLLLPALKREEGGGRDPNYVIYNLYEKNQPQT